MKIQNIFEQKESMCLMKYQCKECKKIETLWNSRPRITPFMIGCSSDGCKGEMSHIEWGKDVFAPNHKPKDGDRIFVDVSIEAMEKICLKKIEDYWDHKEYPMSNMAKTKPLALEMLMRDWSWGEPMVITWNKSRNQKIAEGDFSGGIG